MKFAYTSLALLLFAFVLPGCADKSENKLATEGATAEDIAKYEAELAAVNSDAAFENLEEDE